MFPLILFALGLLLVAASVLRGEASIALLVFIPIIYGGGWILGLGILLIISSFMSFFFISTDVKRTKSQSRYGGVVFIGPIPIIFGSDQKITKIMLYIGLAISMCLLLLFLIFWW